MNAIFLISVVGKNKPDTLNNLADLTHSYQGKWLSSRVINLGGIFSSLIKVEVPKDKSDSLQTALKAVADLELTIYPAIENDSKKDIFTNLIIDAEDRPGLINDITRVLLDNSIHVNNMDCHRLRVAGASSSVFSAEFGLQIPESVSINDIIAEIEKLEPKVVVTKS